MDIKIFDCIPISQLLASTLILVGLVLIIAGFLLMRNARSVLKQNERIRKIMNDFEQHKSSASSHSLKSSQDKK